MSDIFIDPNTGDIAMVNCTPVLTTNLIELVSQRLEIRLNTFLEEWFFNSEVGVPYFEQILVKPFKKDLVESILKNTILETEDVIRITKFESTFSPSTRLYTVTYSVEISTDTPSGDPHSSDVPFLTGNIIDNLTNSIVLSGNDNLVYRTANPDHQC